MKSFVFLENKIIKYKLRYGSFHVSFLFQDLLLGIIKVFLAYRKSNVLAEISNKESKFFLLRSTHCQRTRFLLT